ncbi:MAG: hypothetical protein U0414_33295 [Polyangiaceae bacterium]
MKKRTCLLSLLMVSALAAACSSPTSSGAAASSSAPAPSASSTSSAQTMRLSGPPETSASGPKPPPMLPKRKRPTGWKDEWKPYPEEGESVFEFATTPEATRKDVPDPRRCPIDGPFWGTGVSFWGNPCSEENVAGCAELAERLYESGHWECAKSFHALLCIKDPKLTKPPPGGGDYPMAGYPQCPPETDPRLPWRDSEMRDPVKKGCFVGHDAKACLELAASEKDPTKRQWLGQLAAAWE